MNRRTEAKPVQTSSSRIPVDLERQLIHQETALIAAQQRRDFSAVEALLADDFHEIGSIGRFYTKDEVLEAIRHVQILDYRVDHFRVLLIHPDCVIVTYIATLWRTHHGQESASRSHRSSTWIQQDGVWRAIFHQATTLPLVP
jgi:hypothetical protein